MKRKKHHNHPQEGPEPAHGGDARGPYWQRVHRDWRFWVGVVLFVVAVAVYVMSNDLSTVPAVRR